MFKKDNPDLELASLFPRHDESTSQSEASQTPCQTKSEADQKPCQPKRGSGFNIGGIVLVTNSVLLLFCVISIIVIAINLADSISRSKNLEQLIRLKNCIGESGTSKDTATKKVIDGSRSSNTKGQKGQRGPMGPHGQEGIKGDMGNPGPEGRQGIKGDTGSTGPRGPHGREGIKGDMGNPGPEGRQGIKGDTGSTGPRGPQGIKGEKGVRGLIGFTGYKGDTGETGIPGKPGIKGSSGQKGSNGEQGQKGEKGTSGMTGITGMKGDKGGKGEKGEWIKCKDGWIAFDRSCYFIEFKAKKNFADAQKDCLSRGASLAKINNMWENWFLKSLVRERNAGNMYFGLHDGAREGKFLWMVDNSSVTFTDWGPGQPDNSGNREDCGHYWDGANYLWNDARCSSIQGYICEIAY